MPLHPPKRNVSDAENKLRLLYCVHALEQTSETQLWPFVASLDLMDYMPMQLLLHELLSGGDLCIGAEALSDMISLSPQGQESLRLFEDRIMPSDRAQMDAAAPAYRAQLQKRRQVRTVYESARDEDYRVLLSLSEGELPTLKIRLQTASRAYAAKSLQAFEKTASTILSYLYGLDTTEDAAQADAADAPCLAPALTVYSNREYVVTAQLSLPEVCFELALLLPTHRSALDFRLLLSSSVQQNETAQRLFSLLCV